MSKNAPAQLAPFNPLLRSSVENAAAHLGVSRAHLWKRIAAGEIQTIRDGRRVFVPNAEIVRLSSVQP